MSPRENVPCAVVKITSPTEKPFDGSSAYKFANSDGVGLPSVYFNKIPSPVLYATECVESRYTWPPTYKFAGSEEPMSEPTKASSMASDCVGGLAFVPSHENILSATTEAASSWLLFGLNDNPPVALTAPVANRLPVGSNFLTAPPPNSLT